MSPMFWYGNKQLLEIIGDSKNQDLAVYTFGRQEKQ